MGKSLEEVKHIEVLHVFLDSLPPSIAALVTTYHQDICLHYSERHLTSIGQLLESIEAHPVYALLDTYPDLVNRFQRGGWAGCCARKVSEHQITRPRGRVGGGGGNRLSLASPKPLVPSDVYGAVPYIYIWVGVAGGP